MPRSRRRGDRAGDFCRSTSRILERPLRRLAAGSSVTIYFSVLDLGFGGAFVRFVARYRARRDARGLNEIASTLFFVYTGAGLVAYLIAAVVAFNLGALFRITPEQAEVGRWLLLIIGVQVALNFPFSVFGGVVNGFQRYNVNSGVSIASSVAVAASTLPS